MTTTKAASAIPTGTWQSDPIHSSVGFAVKQVVGTFRGAFEEFDATLSDQSGEPRFSGRAKVESVRVKEENLYSSLLAPDFFDAERYPEIAFESKQVSRDDDKVTVDGELTIKGVTKQVVARGEITGPAPGSDGNDRIGIDLETIVDRHDYGLDWQMELPGGSKALGDDVTLMVHMQLINQA